MSACCAPGRCLNGWMDEAKWYDLGLGTWNSSPCGILKGKYSDWNTYPSYPEFEEHINSHDIIILHGIYKPHHLHERILALEMSIIRNRLCFLFVPFDCFAGWVGTSGGAFVCLTGDISEITSKHPAKTTQKSKRFLCRVQQWQGKVWLRKFSKEVPDFWGWGVWKFSRFSKCLRWNVRNKKKLFIPAKKVWWLFNKNCWWETSGSPSTSLDLARFWPLWTKVKRVVIWQNANWKMVHLQWWWGIGIPNLHCMEVIWVLCDSDTVYNIVSIRYP